MCHFRTFSTPPSFRIPQGSPRILNSIENIAVITFCRSKIWFRDGILSNGRQRLLRIIFRITAFCTTSVQKWFCFSHSGTPPTKITG